jgi:hypothetical protein
VIKTRALNLAKARVLKLAAELAELDADAKAARLAKAKKMAQLNGAYGAAVAVKDAEAGKYSVFLCDGRGPLTFKTEHLRAKDLPAGSSVEIHGFKGEAIDDTPEAKAAADEAVTFNGLPGVVEKVLRSYEEDGGSVYKFAVRLSDGRGPFYLFAKNLRNKPVAIGSTSSIGGAPTLLQSTDPKHPYSMATNPITMADDLSDEVAKERFEGDYFANQAEAFRYICHTHCNVFFLNAFPLSHTLIPPYSRTLVPSYLGTRCGRKRLLGLRSNKAVVW